MFIFVGERNFVSPTRSRACVAHSRLSKRLAVILMNLNLIYNAHNNVALSHICALYVDFYYATWS
jgi:hypothetical protein